MDYRATLLRLTQLWLQGTAEGRQAFFELLAKAKRRPRDRGAPDGSGHAVGGGSLEHMVWGGFCQVLGDTEFQETQTMEEIAAYVSHRQPYVGRAYISYDFRPKMQMEQRTVFEEAAAFLRSLQDREYLLAAARDDLEARRDALVTSWQALPLATTWKRRLVCDEVLRQVFELLVTQMRFPGHRFEIWERTPARLMMDITKRPHANLLALVPWGRRALDALMGTDLVLLSWLYTRGHVAFSLI